MKAIRGCALGRRSARDPGVRQILVARASERAAREAFAAQRAARHARAPLQSMGCGARRQGMLAQRPTRAASRGGAGRGEGVTTSANFTRSPAPAA